MKDGGKSILAASMLGGKISLIFAISHRKTMAIQIMVKKMGGEVFLRKVTKI